LRMEKKALRTIIRFYPSFFPTLTLAGEKREEKARKPAKNVGWSGNLQKTWYNRTASNFHNLLLLRYDMV